jgi:hypothetical protein
MFRYVFSLTLIVGLASGAAITTATCDTTTVTGTFSANCNEFNGVRATAQINMFSGTINPESEFSDIVDLSLEAMPVVPGAFAAASANFSIEELMTISGGTGNGFFIPCGTPDFTAQSGIRFAGFDVIECPGSFQPEEGQPFSFGVPQIVDVTGEGSIQAIYPRTDVTAQVILTNILLWDSSGNPIPNGTVTLVTIPEPSDVSLFGVGLTYLMALLIRRMRFRIHSLAAQREKLRAELAAADPEDRPELEKRLRFFEQTDMAVVVSPSQNEIDEFKKKGLDIATHRRRMVRENLETEFKNPNDPLRIVFVCAMWITGFDVPSCSTIYLDKPMRNHTLMQTIARANRVWRDKTNGLIVDYVGVFRNLQKALAIYGTSKTHGETPIHDKSELVSQLREAITATTAFCTERQVDPTKIRDARGFERVKLVEDAVSAVVVNDETRRRYISLAGHVDRLFKSLLPDAAANEFGPMCKVFRVVADKIRSEIPPVDISDVMAEVEAELDLSIGAKNYVMPPIGKTDRYVDLSQIDFDELKEKFDTGRKATEVQKIRGKLAVKLAWMVKLNRTRMDFRDEFQRMIDEYNAGSINVETFFAKLMVFTRKLDAEEKRGIAEQLSEEELVVFDLLTKPDLKLTKAEERAVKKAARTLLEKLKQEKLVLDWRKQQTTRAMVRYTIETVLENELPRAYSTDLYKQKCDAVYQHVYEAYVGQGKSVYGVN